MSSIRTNLWFDTQAEEAARFYCDVFKDSRLGRIALYSAVGQEFHGRPVGSVMTVEFELDGHPFLALNGGPDFAFTEATSQEVRCATQEEVDYYWDRLSDGGDPSGQACGWLKDRFGMSWQIVPHRLDEMIADPDKAKSDRAFAAMLQMKKLDLPALEAAYNGTA